MVGPKSVDKGRPPTEGTPRGDRPTGGLLRIGLGVEPRGPFSWITSPPRPSSPDDTASSSSAMLPVIDPAGLIRGNGIVRRGEL